jgi:hypothetical protein
VPLSQGNKELYPVTHLARDPWRVHQIESGEILMPHAAVFIARNS